VGGKGSGGHNKKPTAQKIAEGNRGRRALNENEPVPGPGAPVMPAELSPRAQAYWQEILPIVEGMNGEGVKLMTAADAIALGQLCLWLAEVDEQTALIEKIGRLIPKKDEKGKAIGVSNNPALKARSDAARHVRAYLAGFGMIPAARSALQGSPDGDKPPSALDGVLNAKDAHDDVVH
jgi:P27 family predicted phage terminase small subunit